MHLAFSATTDQSLLRGELARLLVPGALADPALHRRIDRLARSFRSYADSYPLPLWAPHLAIDQEMRALTEALFPLREVRSVFGALLSRGCRFTPLLEATALHGAASWLDALQELHPFLDHADPAPALASLAEDEEARRDFLFSLFLPRRYGPAFERYPRQAQWLADWLAENRSRLKGRLRALDSACGSGEGTYRLAELVAGAGCEGGSSVHGSTFEPVELFAAAHAYFPHDPVRQDAYRERLGRLQREGAAILFYLDDVGTKGEGGYDVILCNGLLGGPMLWERREVARAVGELAGRLATGGVLLAADRFHDGWKKKLPGEALAAVLEQCGLEPLQVPEGVGGRRR